KQSFGHCIGWGMADKSAFVPVEAVTDRRDDVDVDLDDMLFGKKVRIPVETVVPKPKSLAIYKEDVKGELLLEEGAAYVNMISDSKMADKSAFVPVEAVTDRKGSAEVEADIDAELFGKKSSKCGCI
ncbi:hypothetical protein ANCCEY_10959, partial [Ancylostoma ceylanicum]